MQSSFSKTCKTLQNSKKNNRSLSTTQKAMKPFHYSIIPYMNMIDMNKYSLLFKSTVIEWKYDLVTVQLAIYIPLISNPVA